MVLPASHKTPGYFFSVVIGGPGNAAGAGQLRLLLLGNMIAVDLTGSAPSFTVTAGTRQTSGTADESPIQVFSGDEAATYFGRGSFLHRMAKAAFAVFQTAAIYGCPIAEGGGATKASATITFVGNATSSGTIRIVVADDSFDLGITSGDTVTAIATNIATEIVTKHPDWPVTAQFLAGVLTVTAKQGGTEGNNIHFRAYWIDGTNVIAIGTSTTKFGTAATITGSGKLASGATADSVANALTNTAPERYHRIAMSDTDTTNINRVRDAMATKDDAQSMLWEQLITGSVASPSTSQTNAASINGERVQLVVAENSDMLPGEIAAQIAALRLFGDAAVVSNSLRGEADKPAANLNGLETKIPLPAAKADYPTAAEIESMLNNGCSPLAPSTAHPGYMTLVASYTTKHKDGGTFNYSAAETKVVTVTDYVAEFIRSDLQITYKGFNLEDDDEDDLPQEKPMVATPNIVRDRIINLLKFLEGESIITEVDALLDEVTVVINSTNRARLDINIPEFPIPNLSIIDATVRQRTL